MESIPIYAIIPFILMLAGIATGPIFFHHMWEQNKNLLIFSLILGIPTSIYLVFTGFSHALIHQLVFDYIPFIVLLGALFVIAGGILVTGFIAAKPSINTIFLAIGAVLASFMGTTGAAMLLIRPLLVTNANRKKTVHTVLFFIAVVANCGGLLTPLGDPPLFLLYLRGAPFTYFFQFLPEWLFINGALLLIYYLVDSYCYKRERPEDIAIDKELVIPIRLKGKMNFLWLAGVVLAVAFINKQYIPLIEKNHYFGFIREGVILLMGVLSLVVTPKRTRLSNNFTWAPITEVAFLFLGIFITMVPALLYLKFNAFKLGISTPTQFYFVTGSLSSFLDNAPTAVALHSLALGLQDQFATLFSGVPLVAGIPTTLLAAISIGAVFFGSMTYIGNGPNFMVKSIAEENNIKMPHFFKYMYGFSLIVLLPIFILTCYLFIS
ncbi:MAG: sodium:proton antiporter [Bacteroidota bacterium]